MNVRHDREPRDHFRREPYPSNCEGPQAAVAIIATPRASAFARAGEVVPIRKGRKEIVQTK
jgi:hypothetical protein